MALRHLKDYYLEQQQIYQEMLENLPEYKALLEEGRYTEEQYNESVAVIDKIKNNFETLSYIMFLLNEPNKKNKKLPRAMKAFYEGLSNSSKEAKKKESLDCLAYIKKLIKEGKTNEQIH